MNSKIFLERTSSERGLGMAGALGFVAAICCVWFVWMAIMDGVRDHHQSKVKKRRAWFESLKPKKPKHVNRKVRGYKVKY